MGKQLKKIAKYSMAAALASSALVPSAVALAADEKPATEVVNIVVKNEQGLVKLNLMQYNTMLALGKMKDTDIQYVVADNGEVYSLKDYNTILALTGNSSSAFEKLKEENAGKPDLEIKEGSITEDGKAVTDETPEEKVNETFFYNLAA